MSDDQSPPVRSCVLATSAEEWMAGPERKERGERDTRECDVDAAPRRPADRYPGDPRGWAPAVLRAMGPPLPGVGGLAAEEAVGHVLIALNDAWGNVAGTEA